MFNLMPIIGMNLNISFSPNDGILQPQENFLDFFALSVFLVCLFPIFALTCFELSCLQNVDHHKSGI